MTDRKAGQEGPGERGSFSDKFLQHKDLPSLALGKPGARPANSERTHAHAGRRAAALLLRLGHTRPPQQLALGALGLQHQAD